MKLGVLKEKNINENRVAITPDLVSEYEKLGFDVQIEKSAGEQAGFSDIEYKKQGAKIVTDSDKILAASDIILKVQPLAAIQVSKLKEGNVIVGLLTQEQTPTLIKKYISQKVTTFAMEFIPRITRAQSMEVLSSQSNLAGYKAVIDAVSNFNRVVPMMMTAAGTIKPARVLVLGAGVAGLQAIATAKRLGAIVSAFDVRQAAKEQVESLGAKFIAVADEDNVDGETKAGYAKEMSDKYKKKQAALIHESAKNSDIVICTALIPGKPAPLLITDKIVKDMQPGSVIVDLATASGGNCQLSEVDKIVEKEGVNIIGYSNTPSRIANDASRLYAKNLLSFIKPMANKKLEKLKIDFEDEIIQASLLTHEGQLIHPSLNNEGDK